jgi:hypothetical protein
MNIQFQQPTRDNPNLCKGIYVNLFPSLILIFFRGMLFEQLFETTLGQLFFSSFLIGQKQ